MRLKIKYEEMSPAIKHLQPIVFTNGHAYCCLLGEESESVFGWGETLHMAFLDWEANLNKYIRLRPKQALMAYISKKLKLNTRNKMRPISSSNTDEINK